MDLLLSNPNAYIDVYMLIMVRILGVLIMMPFLGNNSVPVMAKVGLSFFLTAIIINIIPLEINISSDTPIPFAMVVIKEFFVGWFIGFSGYVVFAIYTLAGQFVDYQIGFSMVNVFDPLSETQLTITGNLFYFVFLLLFLVTRSYFYIFYGIKLCFEMIPLGQVQLSTYLYDNFIAFFNTFFTSALLIATPVFFVILITNAILGVLARTVPQLNMFVIGFPIKILLGLSVLFVMMFIFDRYADMVVKQFFDLMNTVIQGMAP